MTRFEVTVRFWLPDGPDVRAVAEWLRNVIERAGGSAFELVKFGEVEKGHQ